MSDQKYISINLSYAIASALLLFAACTQQTPIEQEHITSIDLNQIVLSADQEKNAGIETGKMELREIVDVVNLNGKVYVPPQNLISVSVPMSGYLKSTNLLAGMPVKKGEILAVIEDQQYIQLQESYLTAKVEIEYLESEYNRQKALNESKANSDKIFEQTKANFLAKYIAVKSLEEKLRLIGVDPSTLTAEKISRSINLRSTINGFVASVNINVGKYVNPSDVLFELIDPNDIHLILTVYENDVNKISVGQKLQAFTNSNPDQMYSGEVILVSKNLSISNAAEVQCHFTSYDPRLLPGTFMNVQLEARREKVHTLPEKSVVRYDNINYIFVAKSDGHYTMEKIEVGQSNDGITEVVNAQKFVDQHIVISGAYNLLMALKVANN